MNVLKSYRLSKSVLEHIPKAYGSPSFTSLQNFMNGAFFITSSIDRLHEEHDISYYLNHTAIDPCHVAQESAFTGPQEEISVLVDSILHEDMMRLSEKYERQDIANLAVTTLCDYLWYLDHDFNLFYDIHNSPVEVMLPIASDVLEITKKLPEYQEPINVHNVYTGLRQSA